MIGIVLVVVLGTLAVVGAETKRRWLLAAAKPLATAALLLVLGRMPTGLVEKLVAIGILFSIVGDTFLLFQGDGAFFAGTLAFLTAHVLYAAAFWAFRAPDRPIAPATLIVVASSALLVVKLWRPAGALRPAVVIYACAITLMVGAALGALGGPMPHDAALYAAVGAVLFYISDATLAWDKFRRPIKHAPILTMGVYWVGQIGIALAARAAGP
jgi:uncharacterized membrane protein YhhN